VQHSEEPHEDTRLQRWLVVCGVVVLAFNMRPAAASIGPVLEETIDGLGMDHVTAGVLTTLPVLAFGVFGALAPGLARRLGVHRTTLLSLVSVVAGLVVRATADDVALFLFASVISLAGMATANVLLPSLVKLHFPNRVGLFTALYTTALAIGLTSASALTVPVSDALGSWRWGLGIWAVTAAIAALPWLLLLRHDAAPGVAGGGIALRSVARTRLGWAMALLFGIQSAQAYAMFGWFAQVYRDAGFSAGTAGLLLGLITGVSIPLSLLAPLAAARAANPGPLMLGLVACYPVGYLGLLLVPVEGAWVWALLCGIGSSIFPVVLALITLRTRTADGTAALSGFTQSVGYLVAAVGPFGIGVLYDVTGGWTWPLLALTASALVTAWLAVVVAGSVPLEDELAARTAPVATGADRS
jgi:CP family cyanate transporter-like MFS transporter